MVQNVAGIFRELEPGDFYLLSGIEQGMRFSQWVARSKLPQFSSLTPEEVEYRLERCLKRGLIEKKTLQYVGYSLQFEGYDALALRAFTERDTIQEFGAPIGVGKESDVYEVRSYKPLVIKYHREGYTNFRRVDRERDYTADRSHVSWLYTARKAAEREYSVLEDLYPDVAVPQPIDQNRHAIVMEKMPGQELSSTRLDGNSAAVVLERLLRELAAAFDAGYIHGDMSEYNVFVSEEEVTIFDWPQAVATDHENADELLRRDIENIISYLQRKYPSVVDSVSRAAILEDVMTGTIRPLTAYATANK